MKKILLTLIALSMMTACAHRDSIDEQIDREAALQPSRRFHGGVAVKGHDAIDSSKTLNDGQKERLRELFRSVGLETFQIQDEMSRLKGVLFETMMKSPYDKTKVDALKMRLSKLTDRKLAVMFRALDESEKIIGYLPPEDRGDLYRTLLLEQLPN